MPMELVTELPYDHPYRWDGTTFGGPKLWRPNQIATALWLDAEDTSTITLNGSTVSQWNDKSGNGRNATQATAVNQPTYNATGLNGKSAIVFNGVNSFLTAQVPLSGDNITLIAVTSLSASSNSLLRWQSTGFLIYPYNSTVLLSNDQTLGSPSSGVSGTGVGVYIRERNVAKTTFWNGSQVDSKISENTALPIVSTLNIGSLAGTVEFYNGLASELIVVATNLDAATTKRIEGYLAWKWKLQANLPADHPYKSLPPTA